MRHLIVQPCYQTFSLWWCIHSFCNVINVSHIRPLFGVGIDTCIDQLAHLQVNQNHCWCRQLRSSFAKHTITYIKIQDTTMFTQIFWRLHKKGRCASAQRNIAIRMAHSTVHASIKAAYVTKLLSNKQRGNSYQNSSGWQIICCCQTTDMEQSAGRSASSWQLCSL